MKKLITMLAALATGFFAFGDDATPSNAKATFETDQGYVAGTTISNLTAETANTYYWLLENGADEESGTITAYADGAAKPKEGAAEVGGDQFLAVETGAQPIYRSITAHNSAAAALTALTAVDINDGIFLDTQVKFTPSAEAPTYTAGTKLIVWAQEIEADPDADPAIEAATNLVVTAGSYADPMAQAVFKLVVPEKFDFTAWHRLTIRAIKEVTADDRMISGFCIFVDGTQMAADASDYETKFGLTKSDLTTMGGKFFDKQQLFLSCAVANDDNQQLRAFGVQGSGAVDNLAAYDKDAAKANCSFALGEIQFAVVYTDTEIASFEATFLDDTEIPTAQIGAYDDGKKIITVDGSIEKIKLAVTPAAGYMIVNETASPWTLETAKESFEILTKKIGFVVDGVNFAEDNFKGALDAALLAEDKTLKFAQPFTWDMDESSADGITLPEGDIVFDLNGQTITFTGADTSGEYYFSAGITAPANCNFTVIDSKGNGAITVAGTFDQSVVAVDGGTFTLGNGTDAGAKIAGGIDAEEGVTLVNGFVSKVNEEDTVKAWVTDPSREVKSFDDNFWQIAPRGVKPFAVIIAGVTNEYFTLDQAFAAAGAATDGAATILLKEDATAGGTLAMDQKNVTLDLNGKTLTGNITASAASGSPITTFTIKNGTINGDVEMTNDYMDIYATVNGCVTINNAADLTNIKGTINNPDGTAIVVNGGTVKIANTAVINAETAIDAKAGTVKVLSNSSTSTASIGGAIAATDGVDVAIQGGKFGYDVSNMLADDRMAVKGDDDKWTVVPTIAKIGTDKYASFAAAFNAAQSGDTITLLANVTDATGLTTNGKGATFELTIDFNGKTYTVSKPGAGSTGTAKAAFQFMKGQTIVLKNGTMKAAADNLVEATAPAKNIYRFIQNYANLTLEDMTFDAKNLYIDPNHAEDYFPSAVEVCYGTVSIAGKTSINDKTGMVSLTVDTYKQAGGAYKEGADVTINTTGTIASILCYSEGPYAGEDQLPSDLDLEAGTIGSIAMAGGEDVVVTKAPAVDLSAPEGYVWGNDGTLAKITLPTATVVAKDFSADGIATGVTFTAENKGAGYNDWQAKFILKSDIAIGADEIALYGQYGEYPWTAIEFPGCEAGEEIDVLGLVTDDPDYANITVKDVFTLIQVFNCGIKNIALANDASFDLSLIITDGVTTKTLCSVEDLSVEQSEPATPVATVDGVEYTDLHQALVDGSAAGKVVELIADVDLQNKPWTPIASFAGTFDGKGYTISNLKIEDAGKTEGVGMFNKNVKGQVLRNLIVSNVTVDAPDCMYVGAVLGDMYHYAASTTFTNVTVCGKINIVGYKYVGGVVGHTGYSRIIDCHVDGGNATDSYIGQADTKTDEGQVGGITGMTGEGDYRFFNCSVKNVTMYGHERVGGIAGRIHHDVDIVNCTVENVILDNPEEASIGAIAGISYKDGINLLVNNTASNVTLKNGETLYAFKTIGTLVNAAEGTGIEATSLEFTASKYNFTAGTFKATDDAVDALAAECAAGYIPLANGDGTYTITAVYGITFEVGENGKVETSVTNNILANTQVTITVSPAEGYKLGTLAVTNLATEAEVEVTDDAFTMPQGNVKVYATFVEDAKPLDPEEPSEAYDTPEQAADAAAKINANKEKMINTPTGATPARFTSLFTAVVTADNKVVVELNEDGTNAVKTAAAAIETAVATKLSNITAAEVGGVITLDDVTVEPGFWYGVAATADLTGMKTAEPATWVQATSTTLSGLTAKKPAADKGFFQTKAKATNK